MRVTFRLKLYTDDHFHPLQLSTLLKITWLKCSGLTTNIKIHTFKDQQTAFFGGDKLRYISTNSIKRTKVLPCFDNMPLT